jgi:hypothetical protein
MRPEPRPVPDALLRLDDTWYAPVGSGFDEGDRQEKQGEETSPLAHNPVPRHDGRGPVRFAVPRRVSRR